MDWALGWGEKEWVGRWGDMGSTSSVVTRWMDGGLFSFCLLTWEGLVHRGAN